MGHFKHWFILSSMAVALAIGVCGPILLIHFGGAYYRSLAAIDPGPVQCRNNEVYVERDDICIPGHRPYQ